MFRTLSEIRHTHPRGIFSFAGDDDLLHFSAEIQRELDNLIATWGEEGYLKQWRYPFPGEAYRKLEKGMKSERDRRKAAMRPLK